MLLTNEDLKVALVTTHIALKKVPKAITKKLLRKKIQILNNQLISKFSINNPRITVTGLNPHAGENGEFGNEEVKIITPTVKELKAEGLNLIGPIPADTAFTEKNLANTDCFLAMYHDQGLIPFKTLALEGGVNFTAGLSFIRTSPDHGTAFDIAGKNQADNQSFRNAVFMACDIFRNRTEFKNLTQNALKID